MIWGLLSFAIVLAVIAAVDKWPALRSVGIASLMNHVPPASQISLPSLPSLSSVAGVLRVIDGDTVASGREHYRLVGFDTPEKDDMAHCDSERQLAARATARLAARVTQSIIHLVSTSTAAVSARFAAFAVQMMIGVYWVIALI